MLQRWVAQYICRVLAWRRVWFGVAIHTVAVKPTPAFGGLRLRRVRESFSLRLRSALAVLISPMALPGIVGVIRLVEAAEQPRQVFGILETFLDDRRSVGVCQNLFVKPTVVG